MESSWLLLIYTVPAEPTRKRAFIWREVKKVGAVYLRDGVCILPERPETLAALKAIVAKIEEFEGQASLVHGARLEAARAAAVVEQFGSTRLAEYAEIAGEAGRLLQHVAHETEHRDFSYTELEELESDLGKLRRWTDQVRARDYFSAGPGQPLQDLLQQCEDALAAFLEKAAAVEGAAG